ncbi:MAG: DUF1801 domain-containing protein [Sphingomonadales bacterium]|nr:MAG: DUF1801 domain-containing protein [Sphingomonadales bacterium]
MSKLGPAQRGLADRLRALIVAAAPELREHVKWNAPSYLANGDDRVTLNFAPKGDVRVILHRGVAVKRDEFAFDDPARLAAWPAPDRGVVTLRNDADLDAKESALADLVARWISATG